MCAYSVRWSHILIHTTKHMLLHGLMLFQVLVSNLKCPKVVVLSTLSGRKPCQQVIYNLHVCVNGTNKVKRFE